MYTTATSYPSASQVNSRMASVYLNMFLAVITSMVTSYLVSTSPALMQLLFGTALKWVVLFAPLVFIFLVPIMLNAGIPKAAAHLVLHLFAGLMGLSLATVFVVYTMGSITSAFMGAAVLFGTMSIYGYFTKQSLDNLGKYLFIALIAIIISSVINIFVGSTLFQMLISAVAIVVFLGLTAYDTQQIREQIYNDVPNVEITGALSLYLNFINLFIHLLSLFGTKKE